MKTQKPLTLDQTVEALHTAAEESDFLDDVLSMSKEEAQKDLQKAGVDLDALDARMAAREAEIRLAQDGPAPETSKSVVAIVRGFSKKLAALILAIGIFVGSLGTWVVETFTAAAPVVGPAIAFAPQPPAEEYRNKAFNECGRGQWQQCLNDFDRAQDLDPIGDKQQEVQDARTRAKNALYP
jgi:hypothetical protein